ncbi:MAG: cyclic peptide export ABC transporter [Campylobacterales bacterium]|nr:cyclic peptide export ABC transporter [Campylobacterales bacterium]
MLPDIAKFFRQEGDSSFWYSVTIIGAISAIANAGLLAIINLAAKLTYSSTLNYNFLAMYVIVFAIFFLAKKFAILEANKEIEKILKDIRTRISHKIKASELLTIEQLDSAKIFMRLTRDTTLISQASIEILATLQSLMMVFFALLYILIISPPMFITIVSAIVLTVAIYTIFSKEAQKELAKGGMIEEEFFHSLEATLDGFKEIKINSAKRDFFYAKHVAILERLYNLRINLSQRFTAIMMFAETFLYILLGTLVFVVPHFIFEDSVTIIQVTAAMLFIIGPIDNALYLFPMVSNINRSIKNIYTLEENLERQLQLTPTIQGANTFENFNELKLKSLRFDYYNQENEQLFGIGPIDLTIERGEVIFILGGNGSGKSTLMKTLLSLYPASSGNIYIDDQRLTQQNYQSYRDLFGIILSDFYLFQELYTNHNLNYGYIEELLEEMGLAHKTRFVDGKFTNVNLSTGQRKRLALIGSILEDKPIYIFDEWAADQDPQFKEYFYHTILPKLKNEGKTIIAVTHDQAYFDLCDRAFRMEDGKLIPHKGSL